MEEARKIYYEIRAIYGSPYFDTEEEQVKSIMIIKEATKDYSKEYILAKAKILASKTPSDFKQRLSTIIQSRFWM